MISDSQVHIWAADSPERPWPKDYPLRPHRELPLGAAEIIGEMDAAGVDRVVLTPPGWEGDRIDVGLQAVKDYPGRFGVVSRLNLQQPRSLAHWLQPGLIGLRTIYLVPEEFGWLLDGTSDWLFTEAQEHGIPVMVCAPRQTSAVGEIAKRYPDLRVILDHLGLGGVPKGDPVAFQKGLEPLWALADLPNLALKVSALPNFVNEDYPFPTLQEVVRRVVSTFGAERCMWGSDLSTLRCPYVDWRRAMTDAADYLSDKERQLLMGDALADWLGWPT